MVHFETGKVVRLFAAYSAIRWLLLLNFGLFALALLCGFVVAPHNNQPEAGGLGPLLDEYPTNRILSDHTVGYIPALHNQIASPVSGSGWLTLWNPHNECGIPIGPSGGTSRAYFLTNLLCFVFQIFGCHDAFQLYSWLALLTLCLMGMFTFSFAEEMQFHPAACYVSAITLSGGTFCIFWLPQLVFLSSLCWTMGLYWLVSAYIRRGNPWSLVGVVFCVNSLLIAGYPVLIVLFAYSLVPYTLLALAMHEKRPRPILLKATALLAAVVVGVAAALPVYLDLYHTASESTRLATTDDSFFLQVFPSFATRSDWLTFLATNIDPFALGGSNALPYPQCASGALLSPLAILLVAIAVAFTGQRPVWFWLCMIAVYLLLNCWSSGYLFAVRHLGLGFSRCRTSWGTLVPVCVLSGMVVDHVLRGRDSRQIWIGFASGVAGLFLFYAALQQSGMHPSHAAIAAATAIAIALGLCLRLRSPLGTVLLTSATVIAYGSFTILLRPLSTICRHSSLTDALHETGDDLCRYACVGPMTALPPNEESLFGLNSIHCYDPLLSRRYKQVVSNWSKAELTGDGRVFRQLDRDSMADRSEALTLAGVKYLVSEQSLAVSWVEAVAKVDRFYLYKNRSPVRMQFQTDAFVLGDSNQARLIAIERPNARPVDRISNSSDRLRLATTALGTESLLFVSQQYHDYWQASCHGERLKTVIINDFYQGVILPPETDDVELQFRPWVRWAWILQVGFAAMGVAFLVVAKLPSLVRRQFFDRFKWYCVCSWRRSSVG